MTATMAWPNAAEMTPDFKPGVSCTMFRQEKPSSHTLKIFSFETAKNMSRLVALYRSLTDDEFLNLRIGPVRSPGVAFLNSTDENYLLGLACKEKLEDLNSIASVVSRLGKHCIDEELNAFEIAYKNMKQGIIDISNLAFNSKHVVKMIEKLEKYIKTTSLLYTSLLALKELEISEKKLQRWKNSPNNNHPSDDTDIDNFNDKLSLQRKQVRYFLQISLWNKKFDKSVGLMARIVCIVYARICVVFGTFVPGLLSITSNAAKPKKYSLKRLYASNLKPTNTKVHPETNNHFVKQDKEVKKIAKSGPLLKPSKIKQDPKTHFLSHELSPDVKGLGGLHSDVDKTDKAASQKTKIEGNNIKRNERLLQSVPANTVGAAGLAFRYANIIIMAETIFYATTFINDEARKHMFNMLPMNLKQTLRGKLRGHWYKDEREGQDLAEGWIEALEDIIGWLAPVAHDTLKWQQERNLDQQGLDASRTVLLFQTLHFSDLEKTEAAIVEVLVGLSFICRYENRQETDGGVCNKVP